MHKIKVELDKDTGDYFLLLDNFKQYFEDLSKIKYYKLELVHDLDSGDCILLSCYDSKKKLINAKQTKRSK